MSKKAKPAETETGSKIIALNKKARFDYHIVETFEAGIVLTGAEIKSVRSNGVTLNESFVRPYQGELYLLGAHITLYSHSGLKEYDPIRKRKLLMHREEIDRLIGRVEQKGLTLVPLSLYLKKGRAKIELALCKGKAAPDKRDSIRDRESNREMARALKNRSR